MKNKLSRMIPTACDNVWNSHRAGSQISRVNSTTAGIIFAPLLYLCLCAVILENGCVYCCPMVGCAPDKCTSVSGINSCSGCVSGYYKLENKQECNACASQCSSCTSWTACQSCQQGYFIDEGASVCVACSANCDTCTSRTSCTRCSTGFSFSSETKACASDADQNSGKKEESGGSSIGPIIGYVVSGLVLVICCTITIIHQRRKQQLEAKAKADFNTENANQNQIAPISAMAPQAVNSTTRIAVSPTRAKIVLPKPARTEMAWHNQNGEDVSGSDQRNLAQEPQRAIAPSPQISSSPEKMNFLLKGQRPSGAEHIGLLSAPQASTFLKLNSPMITATASTPRSAFGGGSTSKNNSQRETPLVKSKPSGFGGFSKVLISQGVSSNSITGGNSSPSKVKVFNSPGTQSPDKKEGGFTSNLSRIKRIEQRVS